MVPKTDPVAIGRAVDLIGSYSLPAGIEPKETQEVFGVHHLKYQDQAEATEILMVLFPRSSAMNERAARAQSMSQRATHLSDLPTLAERTRHQFPCDGKTVEVVEEFGKTEAAEFSVYSAIIEHPVGYLYVLFAMQDDYSTPAEAPDSTGQNEAPSPPRVVMNRQQVAEFFSSFEPPKPAKD